MSGRSSLRKTTSKRSLMMKPMAWLLAMLMMASLAGNLLGQGGKPAPAASADYDYFKLGEISYGLRQVDYYDSIKDVLKQRMDEHRKLMQKLNLS